MGDDVRRAFFSGPVSGLEVVQLQDSVAQLWHTFDIRGHNASPVSGLGLARVGYVYSRFNSRFGVVAGDRLSEISMSPVSGHSN